jgi:translation initiation factor 2B subunit (eIF-2B alpha/beta/delta family)
MVLVGAEGVVESGGIINKLGTYQIAICASAHNVPVYVAAESYKFARIFPLNQVALPAASFVLCMTTNLIETKCMCFWVAGAGRR